MTCRRRTGYDAWHWCRKHANWPSNNYNEQPGSGRVPFKRAPFITLVACLYSAPSFAQTERGWVDVNIGIAVAAEDSYATELNRTLFSETATFGAEYSFPRGAAFDFGGGYMITAIVGLGVNFQGTAHKDSPFLTINIPHPNFFNAHASDTSIGDTELERTEGSVNIQAMINATPNSDRLRVRFFGGPTYFRVKQDTIDNIRYNQAFQLFNRGNAVEITTYEFSEAEGQWMGASRWSRRLCLLHSYRRCRRSHSFQSRQC